MYIEKWIVNIKGRIYHGWYRTAADAVFGALRTDANAAKGEYTDLAIHVSLMPSPRGTKRRSTTGCKRIA